MISKVGRGSFYVSIQRVDLLTKSDLGKQRKFEDGYADEGWILINDPVVADLIMSTYADQINRKILKVVSQAPHGMMDILRACGVPQTTVYRKIRSLIKNQFLVPYDRVRKDGRKKTRRYIATIKSFQMEISNLNDIIVKAKFSNPAGDYQVFDSSK